MKKIFVICILFSLVSGLFAQNEKTSFPYKNTIKLSPLGFNYNSFFLNYERRIGNNLGLQITGGLLYSEDDQSYTPFNLFDYTTNATMMGYLSEFQFRDYLFSKQPSPKNSRRLFMAPYCFYRQYQVTDFYYYEENNQIQYFKDYSVKSFGGGCVIGFCIEANKFSLEIFTGGGIKLSKTNMEKEVEKHFNEDNFSIAYKGIVPKFGCNLGFNF